MTATGHFHGHTVHWDTNDALWRYSDTNEPATECRPCVQCSNYPTAAAFDACLGMIEGVVSACCGHGVETGYRRWA